MERGVGMKRSRVGVAASLFLFLGTTSAVDATTFHQYSVGVESTGASGFTGVQSTRLDSTITGIPNSGCTSAFSGDPVYQTSWVILTSDAQNWMELGTGHQCQGTYNYWFWGYGSSGAWHPLGTQLGITLGASHTFKIRRALASGTGEETYFFDVDLANKGSKVSSSSGVKVEAGLESYWNPVNVIYTLTSLKSQKNDGSFVSWSGRDAMILGASMCGSWVSDTSWEAGEGSPCL